MGSAARAVAETGFFVPTLSLDDPVNTFCPWRWFTAAGWASSATMHALQAPPRPRPAARAPQVSPGPEAAA